MNEDVRHEQDRARIEKLLEWIAVTPSGKDLVEFVRNTKLRIAFDESLYNGAAAFSPAPRCIRLSPYASEEHLAISLCHELRHAWQEREGLVLKSAKHVFDYLVNTRFAEADAFSFASQMAYELERAHPRLAFNKAAMKICKPVHLAFTKAVNGKNSDAAVTIARSKAFDAWFTAPIRSQYDHDALKAVRSFWYRRSQGIRNALSFNKKRTDGQAPYMSEEFLREFGAQTKGENYLEGKYLFDDLYIGNLSLWAERYIERTVTKYDQSDQSMIYDFL